MWKVSNAATSACKQAGDFHEERSCDALWKTTFQKKVCACVSPIKFNGKYKYLSGEYMPTNLRWISEAYENAYKKTDIILGEKQREKKCRRLSKYIM